MIRFKIRVASYIVPMLLVCPLPSFAVKDHVCEYPKGNGTTNCNDDPPVGGLNAPCQEGVDYRGCKVEEDVSCDPNGTKKVKVDIRFGKCADYIWGFGCVYSVQTKKVEYDTKCL